MHEFNNIYYAGNIKKSSLVVKCSCLHLKLAILNFNFKYFEYGYIMTTSDKFFSIILCEFYSEIRIKPNKQSFQN